MKRNSFLIGVTLCVAITIVAVIVRIDPEVNHDTGSSNYKPEPSTYESARKILGEDFITPEEVSESVWHARQPKYDYTQAQILELQKTIPSAAFLVWCKENDYAVIPPPPEPTSIIDIFDRHGWMFSDKTIWWHEKGKERDKLLKEPVAFKWLAIRRTRPEELASLTAAEQDTLVKARKIEHIPSSSEVLWFMMVLLKVRSDFLYGDWFVRTSSLSSQGEPIAISGMAGGYGISVCCWPGKKANKEVSAVLARVTEKKGR